MRLTSKLCAQHLGWTFKKHWIVQSKRVPRDTGAASILKQTGISVKNFEELQEHGANCKAEKLRNSLVLEDVPQHLHLCHILGDNNVLLEGMQQALLLTKTIEIPSLPKSMHEVMDGVQITGLLERNIKEAIMNAHIFCADQVKLPKKSDELRPAYIFPRKYGIAKEKRISLLLTKLLVECEKLAGRSLNSQRHLLDQVNFKVTVPKNNDLLQFDMSADKIITSSRPIEAIKGKYDAEIADLHPIKSTISIPKTNMYSPETIYPFKKALNFFHPHTIFVHFDKEKLKNIHGTQVNVSQFQSRNLLKAFGIAATRAKALYGDSALESIPKPIVVQSIQTDGCTFHFGVFQLNTLCIDNVEGPKNFWFHESSQDLFQICKYAAGKPVLEGFNIDVFRYIYSFYSNT